MTRTFLYTLALLLAAPSLLRAELTRTIHNELRIEWPGELVYMDFEAGTTNDITSAKLTKARYGKDSEKYTVTNPLNWHVPVQRESVTIEGKAYDRLWFWATLTSATGKDQKGKIRKLGNPSQVDVTFASTPAKSPLTLSQKDNEYLIDNGVYEFRLARYQAFDTPQPLQAIKHWLRGMRPKSTKHWEGSAYFQGTSLVHGVKTEILNQGPVFIDFKYTFDFKPSQAGDTTAVVMALGKQSHTYKPNKIPTEILPKYSHHYEVMLRFVAHDNWIEVVERNHLPRDPKVEGWGVHQYYVFFGETRDHLPYHLIDIPRDQHDKFDTVSWERWFLYDQFGGNDRQQTTAAKPRPDQKGRPFALLRPRWNQGGGGAQDFVLTTGGQTPLSPDQKRKAIERKARDLQKRKSKGEAIKEADLAAADAAYAWARTWKKITPDARLKDIATHAKALNITFPNASTYSPDNPAFGVVAGFPSKWTNPYQSTIAAYVRDKHKGIRVPLIGGSGNKHYTSRSYAFLVGKRSDMRDLDSMVRRHVDWTLAAQINKYKLSWERNPDVAGANILTNRKRLKDLQALIKGNNIDAVKEHLVTHAKLSEELAALRKIADAYKVIEKKAKAEKDKTKRNALNKEAKALRNQKETKDAANQAKKLQKKLGGKDNQVLAMLRGETVSYRNYPTATTYLNSRYQSDANNPTNYGTRRMVNDRFPLSDLFSLGTPYGGADQAAIGYIFTDLDQWPGWHNGWSPGNPNFHTDKYIASIYAAAAMQDHPHAKEWMAFGLDNFNADLKKVFVAPDGVGVECPGYSGYSLSLQLEVAGAIFNSGLGNPIATNPLIKKSAIWHRKLLTPVDRRFGHRHEAPIGDTHRWSSGMGKGFAYLAPFYKQSDPKFASELMGTYKLQKDSGMRMKGHGLMDVFRTDTTIPAASADSMDWSSDVFYGFGTIFRNNFASKRESFLTVKAGPTKGHYHNDELAWHFYSGGTPISLDYNCSYHPRGDHAGLHNTSTFGKVGTVRNNKYNKDVKAMEQAMGIANVGAFVGSRYADVMVAERNSTSLTMSPIDPHDAEFSRRYPSRPTKRLTHRRTLMMVKHDEGSAFEDYIVVREDFNNTAEKQQINLHLLSRDTHIDGNNLLAKGQYDKDIQIHIAPTQDLAIDTHYWAYYDEWPLPPKEYLINAGESQEAYAARMKKLAADNGQTHLPLKDWNMTFGGRDKIGENSAFWDKAIKATKGQCLAPPPNWNSTWTYGEVQQWIKIQNAPGESLLYVMYPHKPGKLATITSTADSITVTVNGKQETISIKANGETRLTRGNESTTLLTADDVPDVGSISPAADAILRKRL